MRSLCISSILFLSCFVFPTHAAEDLPANWKALFEHARAECKPPDGAGVAADISWGEFVKLTQTGLVLEHDGRMIECPQTSLVYRDGVQAKFENLKKQDRVVYWATRSAAPHAQNLCIALSPGEVQRLSKLAVVNKADNPQPK